MLVVMVTVLSVAVALVEIVDMITVLDGVVPAAGTVFVLTDGVVRFVLTHVRHDLFSSTESETTLRLAGRPPGAGVVSEWVQARL